MTKFFYSIICIMPVLVSCLKSTKDTPINVQHLIFTFSEHISKAKAAALFRDDFISLDSFIYILYVQNFSDSIYFVKTFYNKQLIAEHEELYIREPTKWEGWVKPICRFINSRATINRILPNEKIAFLYLIDSYPIDSLNQSFKYSTDSSFFHYNYYNVKFAKLPGGALKIMDSSYTYNLKAEADSLAD